MSHLSNRKQVCKVEKSMSNSENMTAVVPQGSNLVLFLFLLYTSDLPNCLDCSVSALFADDTDFTTSGTTVNEIQDNSELDLKKFKHSF